MGFAYFMGRRWWTGGFHYVGRPEPRNLAERVRRSEDAIAKTRDPESGEPKSRRGLPREGGDSGRGLVKFVVMAKLAARSQSQTLLLGYASAIGVEEHEEVRGSLQLWRQPKHLIYSTRVRGHLSATLARKIIDYVEPMFEQGRVLGFHDWFEMTGYDSASRNELTAWSLRRSSLAQINIGTRATIVSMGVTVAALALGSKVLRRFDSEDALATAFREAMVGTDAKR